MIAWGGLKGGILSGGSSPFLPFGCNYFFDKPIEVLAIEWKNIGYSI